MTHPKEPALPFGPDGPDADDPDLRIDLSAIPTFLRAEGRESDDAGDDIEVPVVTQPVIRPLPVIAEVPDPAALRMVSISPRRLLQLVAIVAIAWGVVSFGRQVATASAASVHAATLRDSNAALQAQVTAMQNELSLIQERRYIDQQARAYRLGTAKEIPFALEPGAPTLPPDAPGSASTRLGAAHVSTTPLEHWLEVLFGSG